MSYIYLSRCRVGSIDSGIALWMKEICLILQLCLLFVLLLLLLSPTFPSREAAPVGQTKKRTPGSAPVVCSLYVPFSPSEDEMGVRASVRACVHIVLSLLLKWMPPPPPPLLHFVCPFLLRCCAASDPDECPFLAFRDMDKNNMRGTGRCTFWNVATE